MDRLRKPAENLLRKKLVETEDVSEEEILHENYELRMHHIELQLQNEELLRVQEELQKSRDEALHEKETLLKEFCHRTKNNMAVIASMMMLQAEAVDNVQAQAILCDMENRIKSMALAHHQLSQNDSFSRIDLYDYFDRLGRRLLKSYFRQSGNVTLSFDLEHVPVSMDTAIPCGLIVNELVSNALKHAFPDGRRGEISIKLRQKESQIIELQVADNGVGIPPYINVRDAKTFGLQSLCLLGELQLKGEVIFDLDHGVTCRVKFRDSLHGGRA